MCGRGLGGGVGVDEVFGDGDFAAVAEVFDVGADGLHDGLAAGGVGVADVELQGDAAGDAVDGAGVDVAGADGGYGVDGSGGEGVAFDGEDEFGGGAEGVAAVGHEERAGVAAEAGDGEAVAGGRGDAGDDADGDAFAFEEGALFDVEFDPGVVVVGRAALTEASGPVKPAAVADLRRGFGRCRLVRRLRGGCRRGSGSRVPERRREPMQPMPKRVGSSEVNMTSSMERRGWRPLRLRARMASRPPRTPTVPSYMPAWGMASVWEPVATAGSVGSVPSQRMKVLPTASSRMVKPSAVARFLSQARARRSSGEKTMRVTAVPSAGCSMEVMVARAWSSCWRRVESIWMGMVWVEFYLCFSLGAGSLFGFIRVQSAWKDFLVCMMAPW